MSFLKACFKEIFKPAEDPRQTAIYTEERQRAMLVKIRTLLKEIEQSRTLLVTKTAVLTEKMDVLDKKAGMDVKNGREDWARQRIQKQQILAQEQQTLQAQIREFDQQEEKLLQAEHRLLTQIELYLARRKALKTRYNLSESQVMLNKGLKKVFDDLADLDELIDIAETETDTIEARASLLSDDVETLLWLKTTAADTDLMGEPMPPETQHQQIDSEITRLKNQDSK